MKGNVESRFCERSALVPFRSDALVLLQSGLKCSSLILAGLSETLVSRCGLRFQNVPFPSVYTSASLLPLKPHCASVCIRDGLAMRDLQLDLGSTQETLAAGLPGRYS